MRTVAASIPVKAPATFAVALLSAHIREHLRTSDGPHLQLRLPLPQPARAVTLEIEAAVHVTYLPSRTGENPRLSIAWNTSNALLFPSFSGTITTTATNAETCTLTISGTHHARFGLVGALFDPLGTHVAHATLETLLREFRDWIETDYFERTKWDAPLVRHAASS